VIPGHATPEGTERFASRFPEQSSAGFYRTAIDLPVSSVGLGTYLGEPDDTADRGYESAIAAAVHHGVNFLDTAINYRNQHSERSIGAALRPLFNSGELRRDEIVVCTKAGFLTQGAVPDFLTREDVAGGMHSMAPDFLADQVDRSRENLQLDTIDVFYLHNPETQLGFVPRAEFEARVGRAFARLEELVSARKIRWYGTATWDGYRRKPGAADALSLVRLLEIARREGGPDHHFRFVQLPFNLAMVEAFVTPSEQVNGENVSVLQAASESGIVVVASATLLQARLASNLPDALAARLPGLRTDAQRAIQFTRSTPGITVALVGMGSAAHVAENLILSNFPPAAREDYLRVFEPAD
jgi:aryl-alcohol dehydrogenase-like predicted oxidoreductase